MDVLNGMIVWCPWLVSLVRKPQRFTGADINSKRGAASGGNPPIARLSGMPIQSCYLPKRELIWESLAGLRG